MIPQILLISEDDSLAEGIIASLGDNYVIIRGGSQDFIELARTPEIRLVMIDNELPGQVDACDTFDRLRDKHPWVTGLLLVAAVDEALLRRMFQSGFRDFVEKTADRETLRGKVEQALRSAWIQQENTRFQTLLPLYRLGEQFLSSNSEAEVINELKDAVGRLFAEATISVMLYDEQEQCLRIVASRGLDSKLVRSIRVEPGDNISGWVFQQGRPVLLNKETQHHSLFSRYLKRPEIATALSVPMMVRGKILGVLNVSRTAEKERFSDADTEMLAVICSQASLALENVRALKLMEEKSRMRALFERYVTPEVAELLIASDADLLELGEIRDVTVLFADIRNFTRLVQKLNLTELRLFLNEVFQVFTETILEQKGTVDKFMGDAVLAVFGAPVVLENASLTAVRTAIMIRERFDNLVARWNDNCLGFTEIGLGIGITKGEMFIGNVGSQKRFDYTVIGTQVNIAQRLAAESSFCETLITGEVKTAVDAFVKVKEMGSSELRGVERKITVYRIEQDIESQG